MALNTQVRPPLSQTAQQFGATPMANVLGLQMQAFSAAGTLDVEKDIAVCDATGGSFTLTLPGQGVYLGKLYIAKEISGANSVTIDAAGAGTIDGSANYTLPARECVLLVPTAISPTTGLVTWQIVGQTLTAGSDSSAIHVNVAGEIHAIALKAVPVNADELVMEDSAASWAKKRFTVGTLPYFSRSIAGQIAALAAKATPVAADELLINDSAAAGAVNKITIGTIPVAQAQVRSILLRPAADAAVTILGTTGGIELEVSAAGNIAIATDPSCYRGQKVELRAKAVAGGGSYTLVVDGGTLTINATGEAPRIMRSETDTWVVMGLEGATIV